MKRINLFLLVLILLTSCKNNYVHKSTGVDVRFDYNNFTFPIEWQSKEIKPFVKTLAPPYRKRVLDVINTAIGKYPQNIISNNLNKICVFSELKFYDVNYGGTSSFNTVYLVDNFYSAYFIEQTFHHEFITILQRNYSFDTFSFKMLIPDSVMYGNGGLNALKTGDCSTVFDYKLIEKGFLSEYASSCIDEDLSSIAEQLFTPHKNFWNIYHKYPIMKSKIQFVINFYNSIDNIFTEKYFKSFETTSNNENYSDYED